MSYLSKRKIYLREIPNINSRVVVVDTETTGNNTEDNHILEIAAVEIIDGFLTGKTFHAYIKPRREISYSAQQVHKMNKYFYKENFEGFYSSDKEIMHNFISFVGDSLIFAHNAEFDRNFINYELKFWNLPQIPEKRFRCSCHIFKFLFNNDQFHSKIDGFSLAKCCKFFKINVNSEGLHSALYDTLCLAKLMCSIFTFLRLNPDYLLSKHVINLSQFNKVVSKEEYIKWLSVGNNSSTLKNYNSTNNSLNKNLNSSFNNSNRNLKNESTGIKNKSNNTSIMAFLGDKNSNKKNLLASNRENNNNKNKDRKSVV